MKKSTAVQRKRNPISVHAVNDAPECTIGVDIGDTHSMLCFLDAAGEVVEEARIRTSSEAFEARFGGMQRARVVIETGAHSRWIEEVLVTAGHDVLIANARQLALISKNSRKSDRNDAELLARLGRTDPRLLNPVQHRSAAAQQGLAVVRAREALVKARTALINCVRGMVKAVGARMPKCDADNFEMHKDKLPAGLADALTPVMTQIEQLTEAIGNIDVRLKTEMDTLAPGARNLTTIPGVGPVTAVSFCLTIDDPNRFQQSRAVGSYLGLVPRRDQSGAADPQLGITKAGSPQMRRLLLQCSQVLLNICKKSESDLRQWGLKLAGTSQADKRRAVVAVARKLAVLMHRMLVTGKPFDPQHPSRSRPGVPVPATT